jgi:tetratricopeptide (TPR) repeat protein
MMRMVGSFLGRPRTILTLVLASIVGAIVGLIYLKFRGFFWIRRKPDRGRLRFQKAGPKAAGRRFLSLNSSERKSIIIQEGQRMRNRRLRHRYLFLLLFILPALPRQVFPCFIMKIAKGNVILAGNNEDINNPLSKIWFEPPEKGKHGITYFGYGSNYPQGGLNDQGLFFDGVAGYKTDWKPSPQRLEYEGILFRKIMEECATVEDSVAVFQKYNFSPFQLARIFLADRSGASAIVGWFDGELKAIRDAGAFQAIGVKENTGLAMLQAVQDGKNTVRVDDVKDVLKACHREDQNPTQYSNVCDLKNNIVYMYLYHDYSTAVKFDAAEEYRKGKHFYWLHSFFPGNVKAKKAIEDYHQSLLRSFEKVSANSQDSPGPFGRRELSQLGLDLADLKEYQKAVIVLERTAKRYPDLESYSHLAETYQAAGEIKSAIEGYKKVLEWDPKNEKALKALRELIK